MVYRNFLNKAIFLATIIIALAIFYFYSLRTYYMHGDALGYYMYLPSTFIYHDNRHPENLPVDKGIYPYVIASLQTIAKQKTPTGCVIPQYTYGIAFMEAPFFFAIHFYEKIFNSKQANGYSPPYNYMLVISSFVYCVLGLLLVYNTLKRYFNPVHAFYGVILLFLGTNLLWFSLFQGGMAHVPLFFLYALLIWLTIRIHESPMLITFAGIGLVAGLITIIRPVDVLCVLIPLLYNVYNKETLRQKIAFIQTHWLKVLALVVAFCVPILPQLIYWKEFAGSYFYYSYGDQSFHWGDPKIIEGLFYFQNGWLAYTPIMFFSLAGLLFYRRIKQWAWCIWFILPVYIYVIYSWYCYTYINGFGSRPMIHLYPLLAIPFTAFISYISGRRWYTILAFSMACIFFIALNISENLQKAHGILDNDESNMVYNLQTMFRTHLRYNDLVVKDLGETQPDTSKLTRTGTIICNNFNDSLSDHYLRDTASGNGYIYHMGSDVYSPGIDVAYSKAIFKDATWLKCSGKFMYPDPPDYFKHIIVVSSANKLWKGCKVENKVAYANNSADVLLNDCKTNRWSDVYFFVKIPETVTDGDTIRMFIWNAGKRELFMDDLCLELYK